LRNLTAELPLCLPPERLRWPASKLREEAESAPEKFAAKWDDRDVAARAQAAELRTVLNEAVKATTRPKK